METDDSYLTNDDSSDEDWRATPMYKRKAMKRKTGSVDNTSINDRSASANDKATNNKSTIDKSTTETSQLTRVSVDIEMYRNGLFLAIAHFFLDDG